jgi:eukaryotic-like serine/threonine-protein kinase
VNAGELLHALGGNSRFEVVRVLGEGGMGTVYEALDRERSTYVALKTLRDVHPDTRFRFKHEFRSLQDIHHPNLVSLGEMFEESGHLFFTMELIDGASFLDHVRGVAGSSTSEPTLPREDVATHVKVRGETEAPALGSVPPSAPVSVDEGRLRAAFGQLARGLHALHLAGKVHRDVKPSNVLVTAEGRVAILDFGLVQSAAEREREFLVVGTARYMAPEQAAGEAVGPEADWYSVGVMLYLALTGTFPFQPSSQVRPSSRRRAEPPSPSSIVPGVPPDLEALCLDLLRVDPAARPRGSEVLRRLGLEAEPGQLLQRVQDAWFVGRRAELAVLSAAFAAATAGAARVVLIEGESGMGKSALMRRFLERVPAETVVLRGRCYERESVPYKAVDQLMDALGVHLSRLDSADVEALLPPHVEQLEQVFPVLRLARVGRLPVFAWSSSNEGLPGVAMHRPPARLAPASLSLSLDPIGRRACVFAALRELLRRLAARAPLVLSIDDLQWADADSLALLLEVLRLPGAPALLLVATLRRGAGLSQRKIAPVFAREMLLRLSVGRLSAGDGRDLVGSLLESAGAARSLIEPAGSINADTLVEEAGGHPLFIEALLRHRLVQANDGGPVRLDEALWARIRRLEPGARRLLDLAAVAGAPLRRDIAELAEAAEASELPRLIAVLQAENLIRVVGTGRDETLEAYHDRVRETVVRRLDPEDARALHGRLARALELSGSAELEALAVHFQAAGELAAALIYAVRAGDQAAQAFAFDHASRLFRTALALAPPSDAPTRRALEEKLGDALANAGRGAEAAEAYLRAGSDAPAEMRLELERRAAENFLRSGYIDEGMRALRAVAAARDLDIPSTPERALVALLLRRAELRLRGLAFTERAEHDVPASRLARIDVCWSAALGLALVDAVRGAGFQTQNLLLSLQAGEPYRIARALSCEAAFLSTDGGGAQARVDDLLDRAEAIAARTGHPHALGLVAFTTGISRYCVGRFRESVEALDQADVIFRERCTGVQWERGSVASFLTCDLWLLGDLREFVQRVAFYRREAEERGDRYLVTNLRTGFANAAWLLQDDPERAAAEAEAGMGSWSKQGFHFQHFLDFLARAHIGLYRGDGEMGHARLLQDWPRLTRSLTLRMQVARIFSVHLRARTALAGAAESRSPRALLLEADRSAAQLEGERMEWALPFAALTRAAAAHLRGDDARALAKLDEAILRLHQAGLGLFEAAARIRRGQLVRGDAGRAEARVADRWMRSRGVASPARTVAMMAPGFREPA